MIDRRRLLGLVSGAVASGIVRPASAIESDEASMDRLHPLTRSLLERARRIYWSRPPDRDAIERSIREYAELTGWSKPLVIKWMDNPTEVHEHLSAFGLDALLDMGSATFWRRCETPVTNDEELFDRCYDAREEARQLLGVMEAEQLLKAPKLIAKTRAQSSNLSDSDVFRVRAISAQIGWLETSLTAEAATAIANIELVLTLNSSDRSNKFNHLLKVFETYERGLIFTWETPDMLIAV